MDDIQVMGRVGLMLGYVPVGFVDLLHILKHPDMIGYTRAYLDTEEDVVAWLEGE